MENLNVKPIFIAAFPFGGSHETLNDIHEILRAEMPEYHCFVYYAKVEAPEFKVFYEKDIDEAKLEEIKEFIKLQMEGK